MSKRFCCCKYVQLFYGRKMSMFSKTWKESFDHKICLKSKFGKSSLGVYSLLFMTMICDEIKIKDPLSIISGKGRRIFEVNLPTSEDAYYAQLGTIAGYYTQRVHFAESEIEIVEMKKNKDVLNSDHLMLIDLSAMHLQL